MTVYVVDSSVAVKWYVPENLSEEAGTLLDEAHELHAPDLLPAEFGNTLWKKCRNGELSRAEATSVVRALSTVPLRLHSSLTLLEGAVEIALESGRTGYDSLYIALALALDGAMVTADGRLTNALQDTALGASIVHLARL